MSIDPDGVNYVWWQGVLQIYNLYFETKIAEIKLPSVDTHQKAMDIVEQILDSGEVSALVDAAIAGEELNETDETALRDMVWDYLCV